ncbi:trehalose synthase complex regulatory subunit Tps3p [Monosporozyma servazzii]
MTIIVASLFLPQGPQFDTDLLDETLMSNLDQSLINIDTDQWKTLRAASPLYNKTINPGAAPQPFVEQQNTSQDSLLENYTLPRIKSATAIDQLLTSDEFMANLTARSSKVTTPNATIPQQDERIEIPLAHKSFYRIGGKQNQSVHEFFTLKKSNSGTISSENLPYINLKGSASSEHLLKNVNASLLKSTLKHSISSGHVPTNKTATTTTSNVSNSEPTAGAINKNKSQEYILKPKSHLAKDAMKDSSSLNNTSDESQDFDHPNIVPKFGGFSDIRNLRLKTTMMLYDQQDIFQNLPWRIVSQKHANNSIRDALLDLIGGSKGGYDDSDEEVNWVGTMGIPTDDVPANVMNNIQVELESNHHCYSVLPNNDTFKGAYFTFCKKILWPILHYQLPTDDIPAPQNLKEKTAWADYVQMNRLIAEQCIKIYKEGDTIWVHDYHLMLVPKMVRDALPNAKIGFFHHVSFPSSELFRCLAQRNHILEGILGANFVAFQSFEYLGHFLQTCNRILMADVTIPDKEIQYQGQIVKLAAIPMGIDSFRIQSRVINDPRVNHWRNLIREKWDGMKLIMSIDSLDMIKGLVQKLKSYEMFLKENPNLIGKITLLQICNTSKVNDSIDLKRRVMIIIDRINSLSVNINIPPPVMFLQQDLELPQILASYCEADLYWVNSLREGMNLKCHEFITCSIDKHSPLMISEFTGSASILQRGALLVNPWDLDHVSKMIKYALYDMSPKLKRYNWKQMMRDVINNDSESWLDHNLSSIDSSWKHIQERTTMDKLSFESLANDYSNTEKHFFLFKISSPPTSRMISILNDLSNPNNNNIVYIMNSFSKSTSEILYNRVSNIGLIAENGAYVRLLNGSWYTMVNNTEWKSEVIKIFDDKMERLPGSYYKIYDSMIVFHTENAEDKERISNVIGEAMIHINTMFNESNIHAFTLNNVVYVQQTGLSLRALKFILRLYNSYNEDETPTLESPKSSTVESWQTASEDDESGEVNNTQSTQHRPIDFACVTGSSSPIIDPIFEFIKKEMDKGVLPCGHTVVYGSTQNTHALEHVNGLNGLMNIISRLNRS